jgi:hypothetical protein
MVNMNSEKVWLVTLMAFHVDVLVARHRLVEGILVTRLVMLENVMIQIVPSHVKNLNLIAAILVMPLVTMANVPIPLARKR